MKTAGIIGGIGPESTIFDEAGITLVTPEPDEQAYVHDKYMTELVNAIFLPATRDGLIAIIERLKVRKGIEGVILGGTEPPLILRDASAAGIPLLDTTSLHVQEVVRRLLS